MIFHLKFMRKIRIGGESSAWFGFHPGMEKQPVKNKKGADFHHARFYIQSAEPF